VSEQSKLSPSMLFDVYQEETKEVLPQKLEPTKKKGKARAFFGFISKICSTSKEEMKRDSMSESIRPIRKQTMKKAD